MIVQLIPNFVENSTGSNTPVSQFQSAHGSQKVHDANISLDEVYELSLIRVVIRGHAHEFTRQACHGKLQPDIFVIRRGILLL